jgi:prevent-host-death family protein
MKISVAEAKNRLPELIKAAENGEAITICRRGKPVVDLVRTSKPAAESPKFGTLIAIQDPGWWKPMSEGEVDSLLEECR